ncbi:MAG TPA: hypothetical protein VL282_03140, partial [Tepidisphaeraceae bacterium]|nr:hypothetical protein [Tepidisphaeraceae bacterium]
PRPHVGFKFHAVLVVNSAHLASKASPDTDRWLPIFWALDYFKVAQATTQHESGWRMNAVDEKRVPTKEKAVDAFVAAMNAWDESAADAAAAGAARTCDAKQAFELFARFGPRDFRDIGHKQIYVANSFRTLSVIGWQHAEPVLRSLAYALLMFEDHNPAHADLDADRPWKRNAQLAPKIREQWSEGKLDDGATKKMLATLRGAPSSDSAEQVVELLNANVSPQSVWDAVLCGAGELLMHHPNIISLHAVTTSNAMHYAFSASNDDHTRRMLMLQSAAFLPLFRDASGGADKKVRLDEFEPIATKASGDGAVGEIFDTAGEDRTKAAAKAFSYLRDGGDAKAMIHAARRLVFLKGNNSHDYKFSSAVLEDYDHLSPAWRDRYLASSLYLLPTSRQADNALVRRTRAALDSKEGS